MGSRGSVIPYFVSLKDQEELPITDNRMSRFMISLEQGVDLFGMHSKIWWAERFMLKNTFYESNGDC